MIEILYKWKTENGEGATYSALIQVYKQMKNQEAVELIEGHYKKNHSELIRLYCYNYSIYIGSNPPLASGTDLKLPISKGIYTIVQRIMVSTVGRIIMHLIKKVDYSRVSQAF